jgi:hypothetical protein
VARSAGDDGAGALKLATVMALTAQLKGRKAAVVVQVGRRLLLDDSSWCSLLALCRELY